MFPNSRDWKFAGFLREKSVSREMAFGNADLYCTYSCIDNSGKKIVQNPHERVLSVFFESIVEKPVFFFILFPGQLPVGCMPVITNLSSLSLFVAAFMSSCILQNFKSFSPDKFFTVFIHFLCKTYVLMHIF